MTGAWKESSHRAKTTNVSSGTSADEFMFSFDASRSSSVYGNSTTVQPESIVGMWLVKAYGTVVDTGQINEQQYIDDRIAALPNTFLPRTGGTMTGSITFLPHIMDSNWENISKGSSTLILYGKKGTIESDKRISLTSFVTRDATGTDADDGFSRYSCLETQIDPSGNVGVALLCYKNEADTQKIASLSISSNVDGTKNAKFDGKEIDRINSSGSNYIRYESGLQICFDWVANRVDGVSTTTLPVPYKDSLYAKYVVAEPGSTGTGTGRFVSVSCAAGDTTTTSFKSTVLSTSSTASGTGMRYLTIGWWK